MSRVASALIDRPRLLDRLARARVTFIAAPGGFGKSTLAEAFAVQLGLATMAVDLGAVGPGMGPVLAAVRRAAATAGLAALAESLGPAAGVDLRPDQVAEALRDELARREDPVLLLVDEAQRATAGGDVLLGRLVALLPPSVRLVVSGRTIPDPVVNAAPDALRVGPADLALTKDELAAMARAAGTALDEVAVRTLLAETDGWPAAARVALGVPGRPVSGRTGLAASLTSLMEGLGPDVANAMVALAGPPLLDEPIAAIIAGPGSLVLAAEVGLPIRRRADGWLELPDPVRVALRSGQAPAPAIVAAVAGRYLDVGAVHVAIDWLLDAGDPETRAATLAGRHGHELELLDVAELRALLSSLPDDVLARYPRLLLAAARAAEASVQIGWRAALLARAAAAASASGDAALGREVAAEQAADASRSGDVTAATALAQAALAGGGSDERRTRAVALTALGRIRAFSRDPAAMIEAAGLLAEAAILLRPIGAPDLLRGTLQALGYGVHFARGDLAAAIAALREAADLAPGAIRTRAGVQTFLADALVYAGELDEAEAVLRDVLGVAGRLGDHRLLGYHAWMQAGIASRRGDAAAVGAWLAEAERHPADWFAHPTGIEFLADAVDHLGRVGEHEEAARYLARVEARCLADGHEGVDQIAHVARSIHAARWGDPSAAERDLRDCLSMEQVAPREHWRIHLLRAHAALRGGDVPAARKLARRAFAAATAMGLPTLPRSLEAEITAGLMALLEAEPGVAGDDLPVTSPARLHVRLMGAFAVTADGRPADPPEGKPSQLVKLLAVSDRLVPIDEVVEVLWPDADADVGRRRVRNVLARIRASCGELVLRDGESLRLDPAVEVDLARFEAEARAALAAGTGTQEALARGALSRFAGELLPGDRYEDYTAVPRERLVVRHVALLDRLAALCAERGDVDEALRLMDEAIAAEPLDERRYHAAVRIAQRHGRRDRAIRFVARALAMEAELGDEPSPETARLANDLGVTFTAASR